MELKDQRHEREIQRKHEVIDILAKIAPQRAASLETTVDTVHLGRKEDGRNRLVIIQFTMRQERDFFWKTTKNFKVCKELGIHFKEDFCKEDREARAAVWPKMERAKAVGKIVYYRGPAGYIDGVRVIPD